MITRAQRRAADLERHAARALKSTRTARIGSRRTEADVATIEVGGFVLQAECKARTRAPKLIVDGLDQARRYAPHAEPIVVIRPKGSAALVALALDVFCGLVGIKSDVLPTRNRPTRRDPRQMELGL